MMLQHQIGGHASVTSDESGTLVIKPAAPREIAFYQLLHSLPAPSQKDSRIPAASNLATQHPTTDDSIAGVSSNGETKGTNVSPLKREILLSHLQNFLPKFYGTLKVESAPPVAVAELVAAKHPSMQVDQDIHGAGSADGKSITAQRPAESLTECIILQNLTTPFLRPCVMDIKLGTTLYDPTDPGVTEAKRLKMEEKARSRSSEKTGMAITGFQTWDPTSQAYVPRSRQDCGKLQPEELGQAFADYWSMGGKTTSIPNPSPNSATQDAQMDDVAGDADGDQADLGEPTSNSITQPPPNISTPTKPTHSDPHARDMIRSLHALQKTLERFHALISHLEIRFIGASLLIIYEGDPARLRRAWRLVDRGESRGDGLQDEDCLVEEDDYSDIERDEADGLDDVGSGLPQKGKSSKSFFAQIFGGFGAERNDGSQGFGLLDGTPPPSPRPRRRSWSRSHITVPDAQNVIERDGEESECDDSDDEERIPDEDAKDRIPRPFTLRLIDFAHTRLADGEGPDVGFLQGVRSVMALVQGRIRELEVEQGVSDD